MQKFRRITKLFKLLLAIPLDMCLTVGPMARPSLDSLFDDPSPGATPPPPPRPLPEVVTVDDASRIVPGAVDSNSLRPIIQPSSTIGGKSVFAGCSNLRMMFSMFGWRVADQR